MTLSELSWLAVTLVVFLNNLMNLRLYFRLAHPELAIALYIVSKLLPRFRELSEILESTWQDSPVPAGSATSPPPSILSHQPWLRTA